MKIDGACHCGYIRIEAEADPEKTTICHCTDCQTGTGSASRSLYPGHRSRCPDSRRVIARPQRRAAIRGCKPSARAALADLFHHAGRGAAGVLHGARRYPAPARPIRAAAAELVPLGLALGDTSRRSYFDKHPIIGMGRATRRSSHEPFEG
jgi:hypothetical protein